MTVTVVVHHPSGQATPQQLEPPSSVNVEPNTVIEFPGVNGADVGYDIAGDDLVVKLPTNGDKITLTGFQALLDTENEATIDWGDGTKLASQADLAAAMAPAAGGEGDVITKVLVHTIGKDDIKSYEIVSGDEILVQQKEIIEFPFVSGDQMLFLIDGDHLIIQFPGELGFLTLLNFQKYLIDPDTAAHIEWGLGGKDVAAVEDVLSQLSPAAGGAEGLAALTPEAGEVTAGGSRAAANTFGDDQFATAFPLNDSFAGPQARTAPPLPEPDPLIIVAEDPPELPPPPPPPEVEPLTFIHDETAGLQDGPDPTNDDRGEGANPDNDNVGRPLPQTLLVALQEYGCDSEGVARIGQAMTTIDFDGTPSLDPVVDDTPSGLFSTIDPSQEILLSNFDTNVIIGTIIINEGEEGEFEALIFVVYLNPDTGEVWFAQCEPIYHDVPGDFDEDNPEAGNDEIVQNLSITVTGAGGSTTAPLIIEIQDDGPTIASNETGTSLSVDETVLATNDSKSFVGDFTSAFGADGAGTIGYALSIGGGGGNGSDPGLVDTATGFGVFLYLDGGDVVGRVGSDATTPSSTGAIVFRVSESSGTVTLDQVRAVVHDPNVNANDTETLSADNLIQLTATITDKDGDQDTAVLDIGQNLTFVETVRRLTPTPRGPV